MMRLSLTSYAAQLDIGPRSAIGEALSEGHRVELVAEPGRCLSESEALDAWRQDRPLTVIL